MEQEKYTNSDKVMKIIRGIIILVCCVGIVMLVSYLGKVYKKGLLVTVDIYLAGPIQNYVFEIFENGDFYITAKENVEDYNTTSHKLSESQIEKIKILLNEVIKNETGQFNALGYLSFITIVSDGKEIRFVYGNPDIPQSDELITMLVELSPIKMIDSFGNPLKPGDFSELTQG